MKILVCLKQVPDMEANPEIRSDLLWIKENNIAFRMNRYDEYALEEALRIKEEFIGTIVDVITVGPVRASSVLIKGLEKGADNAVHIKCSDFSLSASETASLIADYASEKNYDIIFTGVMSEDAMQCMTGPVIASLLSLPCAVSVLKSSVDLKKNMITVDSELEGGIIETIDVLIPCVITMQTGVNQPGYPSLSGKLRAKGMSPFLIDADISEFGSNKKDYTLVYPKSETKGVTLTGSIEDKADRLIDLLHERGLL